MSENVELMRAILVGFLAASAFFATAFPVLYLFSTWYSTRVGKLIMLQSVSFALALDSTLLFALWEVENITIRFWTSLVVFMLLTFSSARLTWMLWSTNHSKKSRLQNKENING